MATVYDIESLLSDIRAFLVANLNTKLAAIDAEKNDGITLAQVNSSAFLDQTAGDHEMMNYDPFVMYGIEEAPETQAVGPGTITPYILFVVVALTDTANDPNVYKRLLRYQRAFRELFEANWANVGGSVKFKVSGSVPIPVNLLDKKRISKVVGVTLSVALAS